MNDDYGPGHSDYWNGDCGTLHPSGCSEGQDLNASVEVLVTAIESRDLDHVRSLLTSAGDHIELNFDRVAIQFLSCDRTAYVRHVPLSDRDFGLLEALLSE
jgi:hypothetical protein